MVNQAWRNWHANNVNKQTNSLCNTLHPDSVHDHTRPPSISIWVRCFSSTPRPTLVAMLCQHKETYCSKHRCVSDILTPCRPRSPTYLEVDLQPFVMKSQLSVEGERWSRHLVPSAPGCMRSQPATRSTLYCEPPLQGAPFTRSARLNVLHSHACRDVLTLLVDYIKLSAASITALYVATYELQVKCTATGHQLAIVQVSWSTVSAVMFNSVGWKAATWKWTGWKLTLISCMENK